MIGKIIIGKSFRGCISYCLENKQKKGEEMRRAEVLSYNLCYGDKKDLIRQFNEVRNLNPNLSKPVMHITLSFPPGEKVDNATLISMTEDCARDLGFDKNQYLVIFHNDTNHQHIHIVVNRVGFDGKTVKDNHNYQKMAVYCRKMEEKHGLVKVLNPKRYLQKQERNLPRFDSRKEKLRNDIRKSLFVSNNYSAFETEMKKLGYQMNKARGIAFTDAQKVRVKGSEVEYSLNKIERVLAMNPEQKSVVLRKTRLKEKSLRPIASQIPISANSGTEKMIQSKATAEILLKSIREPENINPALLKKKKRKRRKLGL